MGRNIPASSSSGNTPARRSLHVGRASVKENDSHASGTTLMEAMDKKIERLTDSLQNLGQKMKRRHEGKKDPETVNENVTLETAVKVNTIEKMVKEMASTQENIRLLVKEKLESRINEISNNLDSMKLLIDQRLEADFDQIKDTDEKLASGTVKIDATEEITKRAEKGKNIEYPRISSADTSITSRQPTSPSSPEDMGIVLYNAGKLVNSITGNTKMETIDWHLWTEPQRANGCIVEKSQDDHNETFIALFVNRSTTRLLWRQGLSPWCAGAGVDISETAKVPLNCNGTAVLAKIVGTEDLEGICWDSTGSLQDWRICDYGKTWSLTCRFAEGDISGCPAFISSEGLSSPRWPLSDIVVKHADSCLHHWQRNEGTKQPWKDNGKIKFATGNIMMSGPSLVRVGANLYVTAVLLSGKLQMFWYDCKDGEWKEGETFGSGFQLTTPCMTQSRYFQYSSPGNFEVCIAKNGKVEHWYRDNTRLRTCPPAVNRTSSPWSRSATFGHDVLNVVGLLQSCFLGSDGKAHNLEVIVERTDRKLQHYWRDGMWSWHDNGLLPS